MESTHVYVTPYSLMSFIKNYYKYPMRYRNPHSCSSHTETSELILKLKIHIYVDYLPDFVYHNNLVIVTEKQQNLAKL